jgi:hypothetical protein
MARSGRPSLPCGLFGAAAFGQQDRVLMPYLIAAAATLGQIQTNQR